jgi:hypothetical protein
MSAAEYENVSEQPIEFDIVASRRTHTTYQMRPVSAENRRSR